MVSRNKYAFCSELWNFARLFSPNRDATSESRSWGEPANVAREIPATPAAAAAVAPVRENLRLENRSELIGPSCGAQHIPPFAEGAGRFAGVESGGNYCVPYQRC